MSKAENFYYQKLLDRYGSRRGFIRACWHKFIYLLGAHNKYRHIDWDKIDCLVFVCKGNICRSAYAEAVAKSLGVGAISCGLSTQSDSPENSVAIEISEQRGVDLKQHKTTPVKSLELKETDLLFAMEPWQANSLKSILNRGHYVALLGLWWLPSRLTSSRSIWIPHKLF